MYLSKLEILGFKSFAQKTSLRFNKGITAIVGPNGCGKTNIVDAIRWALGEQRAALLRSDSMSDVIFNGTRARKPLGMSEVSLTIENTNGVLPTEFSEVTIARRVFRSNEGEYLLNKTRCRLKDILDLFMDTGLSTNAYSVIELKMIEVILSDRTDERRKLFEEAAGVTKYKARRKEALRKLDDVQQDLTRVNDIVKEVEKKVHSLERQAEKAEQYKKLSDELRAKEINLLEREYSALLFRIEPLQQELTRSVETKDTLDKKILEQEGMLQSVEEELNEIETRLHNAQRETAAFTEKVTQTEQAIAVAEERKRSSYETITRSETEIGELTHYKTTLLEKINDVVARIEELHTRIAEAETAEAESNTAFEGVRDTVTAAREDVRRAQAAVIESINAIGAHKNSLQQAKSKIEHLHAQLEKLETNRRSLSGELARVGSERATLLEEEHRLRTELTDAESAFKSQQELKETIKNEIDTLQNESFEIQNNLGKKLSKIEFLANLVEHSTGYSEGVQFLLQSGEWNISHKITIADVFKANPTYRAAIEAALGEAARYLVVPSGAEAESAITALKNHHKGKVTFVCLDRIPHTEPELKLLPEHHHIIGWAADVVQCENEFRALAHAFLNGIAVVNSDEIAQSLIQGGFADGCVTLDGELITKRGIVRGGSRKQSEGAIIGKQEQITELESEVKELQARLEKVQGAISEKDSAYNSIDIQRQATAMRDAQNALASWEKQNAQLEVAAQKTEETLDYSSDEESQVRTEILQLTSLLAPEEPKLIEVSEAKDEAERKANEQAERLSILEVELAQATHRANDAHIRFVQLQSEQQNLTNEHSRLEEAIRTSDLTIEKRKSDRVRAEEDIEQLEKDLFDLRMALDTQRGQHGESEERAKAISDELSTRRAAVQTMIEKIREERHTFESSMTTAHEYEVKLSELKLKSENVIQRAKEEFEINLEQKQFEDEKEFSMTDAREEVRAMKQKLRGLGAVNLLAYEEFQQEKERMEFLQHQRQDLTES
ncbi:MAG TPA: chromosome segregation protein SMC, partial [Candidatus Kapabacteria bacterium]|nr:chromosome segregation protein SMC [Candidatus Kapabacteria bacterium]